MVKGLDCAGSKRITIRITIARSLWLCLHFWLGPLGAYPQYTISELELVMEEHVTECNQSSNLLSKIKMMSFVNIDFWYPNYFNLIASFVSLI